MTEKKPDYLIKFDAEIREGKRTIWPQWLPEMGEEIEFKDFCEGAMNDEIQGAKVIQEHIRGLYPDKPPYYPNRWCYGWIEDKLVYSKFNLQEAEYINNQKRGRLNGKR